MTEQSDETTGTAPRVGGLLSVAGWIGAGGIALAALMLALDSVVGLPIPGQVAVGLGLALGGGLGGVARLFRAEDTGTSDETMTISTAATETTAPEPADLFDGHPDPVLYYASEGHGPVVRAANPAFAETFDVPADRLAGTPLSEALLVAGEATVDADAVTAGALDRVVSCETTAGTARFRLRTIDGERAGYLLYTPAD